MGLCTTRMLTVFRQGRTTKRTTYFCPIVLVFSMEVPRHTKPFHAGDATEIHVCFLEIRKYKLPRLSILISHEKFRLMQFPLLPIKG